MKQYKSSAELFADARVSLLGHLNTGVWSLLLYITIDFFINELVVSIDFGNETINFALVVVFGFITTLFVSLFGVGLASVFLNLQYGLPASIKNVFCFFENADRCVRVRFFVSVGEFLCILPLRLFLHATVKTPLSEKLSLLLPIGVVCVLALAVWTLTFAMTNYLLLDFPDMEPERILRASRKMMRGNRLRLAGLFLHLLPLHVLGIFSLGIANLWVGVCQYACVAAFYKDMMEKGTAAQPV